MQNPLGARDSSTSLSISPSFSPLPCIRANMDSNDATVSRHTTNRLIQAIGFDATRYRAVIGVQSADDTPFSVVAPQNVRGAAKEWRDEITEQKFATEVDDFLALQGRSLPATLDGQTLRKLVHDLTSKLSSEDEADLDIVRAFGDSGQADSAESAQALASADSMIARWSSRNASEPTADLDDKLEHVQLLAHLQALRSNIQAIRDPTEFDWDSMTPL